MSLSSSQPFSLPASISPPPPALPLRNLLRIGDRKCRIDMMASEDQSVLTK